MPLTKLRGAGVVGAESDFFQKHLGRKETVDDDDDEGNFTHTSYNSVYTFF